jgi:hypothetical protein
MAIVDTEIKNKIIEVVDMGNQFLASNFIYQHSVADLY